MDRPVAGSFGGLRRVVPAARSAPVYYDPAIILEVYSAIEIVPWRSLGYIRSGFKKDRNRTAESPACADDNVLRDCSTEFIGVPCRPRQ